MTQQIEAVSHLADSLADFVTYVQTHLTGDEKGEDVSSKPLFPPNMARNV